MFSRPYVDFTLFYDGLGAGEVLVALELYLLASFLFVFPLFKVRGLRLATSIVITYGLCYFRCGKDCTIHTMPMS